MHLWYRFTRKVIPVVGGFTWVEDDGFRIEHHVLEDNRSLKDNHQLRHYLMSLMSRGMNVNRPLWDVHVLPNYDKGRETVLIARVHQVRKLFLPFELGNDATELRGIAAAFILA